MCIGIYTMTLLFTPTANQYGPQGFCAAAIDSTDVQSDPWCVTFLVGFTAPDLQTPILVQGSASPVGTVFANQSIFSIQSKRSHIIIDKNNLLYVLRSKWCCCQSTRSQWNICLFS